MAQKDTYKTLRAELDALLQSMQRDDIVIDEAMKSYERAMEIIGQLEAQLETAQHTITKLRQKFEDV